MTKKNENEDVEVCGHINKHFHGIDGKLFDLSCTLEKGHDGDHFAKAPALRQVDDNFETAERVANGEKVYKLAGKLFMTTEEDGFWSDAASVLASEVSPDLDQLKALRAKKNASDKE